MKYPVMRYPVMKHPVMKHILQKYILPDRADGAWAVKLAASLAMPLLILLFRPIGLTARQSVIVAGVLLAIIWWSSGIIKKIPASIFLTLLFCICSGVELNIIFSFPLSETFPMIAITYLFSQAISNSGLIDKIFQPLLLRLVHTPVQCIIASMAVLCLTMYVIPQPLARLIIVATVFRQFLSRTTLPERTKNVLIFSVFFFSAAINMSAKDADMIMNNVAAGFSDTVITNAMWIRYMTLPTIACCALLLLLIYLLFYRDLHGITFETTKNSDPAPFTRRQKSALAIILATVLMWMTSSLHGINQTVITVTATIFLFGIGMLHKEDWKTIDVTTLIFLTAAFSIGGVMKACGAAEKVFGMVGGIFPAEFSVRYLMTMVLVSMLLHMILGSNSTTLSVVVPGMTVLCGNIVPSPVIVFTAIAAVSYHMLLPFHSVGIMIGASNGYYPARYVTKVGVFTTMFVYFAAAFIFLPYWKFIGLL